MTTDCTTPSAGPFRGALATVTLTAMLVAPTTSWTLRPTPSATATSITEFAGIGLRYVTSQERLARIRALRGKYRDQLPSSEEFNRTKHLDW